MADPLGEAVTTTTTMDAMWYHMCNDVMRASRSTCMQASQPPYVYVAHQELLMDVPFMQTE